MKLKTGIDIIEVNRIKESIQKFGDKFLNRVFTNVEIKYCESKKNQKFQSYAGRFAAKEAIFKATSEFLNNKFEVEWKDVEILNDKNGRPYVKLHYNIKDLVGTENNIDISISHINDYAVASVVLLGGI